MKILVLGRFALGVCVSIAFLGACSSGAGSAPSSATESVEPATIVEALDVGPPTSGSHLYVVNDGGNTVTVYNANSDTVLRTISQGLVVPFSLAFDSSGNLYVANNRNVTEYGAGTSSLIETISNGIGNPSKLVFDHSGNLFVANLGNPSIGGNAVTEYAPGGTSPRRTITQGIDQPRYLTFDSKGNLYVANTGNSSVTVYAGGKSRLSRTITDGIQKPTVLALDASRNLYVAILEAAFRYMRLTRVKRCVRFLKVSSNLKRSTLTQPVTSLSQITTQQHGIRDARLRPILPVADRPFRRLRMVSTTRTL